MIIQPYALPAQVAQGSQFETRELTTRHAGEIVLTPAGGIDMPKTDLQVRMCTTPEQKEAILQLRQRNFFDRLSIQDPYLWTFDHKEHGHFVLCAGEKVIGYAHVQYWPDHRAALRIIVIDEAERKRGYGAHLLKLCEERLRAEGIRVLQTEAGSDVVEFYRGLGYTEMLFNDPDNHPTDKRDVAMGKAL